MAARRTLPFDPIAEAARNWSEHGWEKATVGMAMVTSVMRAQQILLAKVHAALRPFDLTFAQYEALMLLTFTRSGQMPLGKIGQRLQVHPASVTNVIDRLEGKGLVRRVPHAADLRTTLAAITKRGRELADQATRELNSRVFEQVGLSEERCRELIDVIAVLREDVGDFELHPGTRD
jgi:DNA-binding MarR family transcriptional regulator